MQVSRLLVSGCSGVRPRTLERIARGLRDLPHELGVGGVLTQYKKWIAEKHGYINFRGFGMPNVQKQPIQEVFVEFDVRELEEVSEECPSSECSGYRPRADVGQAMGASACVNSHDRVIILGSPGSGKTTLLRFLACSRRAFEENSTEIPIYVPLSELSRARETDQTVDIVRFVAASAGDGACRELEGALTGALANPKRRCLLLLDGLDEVGSQEQVMRLVKCLQEFGDKYPENRFVITSRTAGFDASPWWKCRFGIFRIQEYGDAQRERFAENWANVLSREENKPKQEVLKRLEAAIFSNPACARPRVEPADSYHSYLAERGLRRGVSRDGASIFTRRSSTCFWRRGKATSSPLRSSTTRATSTSTFREFRWLLSDLSLAMQRAERTLAPRWWIADRMQEYLQQKLGFAPEEAKDACDRIIRYLAERTGLIEERGLDVFGFSHRTLQEYFASLGAIDEADASPARNVPTYLREYYFHPQWSEVIRLVAAQLTPPLAESLISAILDDPDPVGRFMHRGGLLALKCLSDGATVANRRLIDSIFNSLVDLGKSRWLGITLEAVDVLEGFQGTRFTDRASETIRDILAAAKDELDSADYNCLSDRVHVAEILESACRRLQRLSWNNEAARKVTITVRGRKHEFVFFNGALLSESPRLWHESVRTMLEDPSVNSGLKEAVVEELGRRAATDRHSRLPLGRILRSGASDSLRAECAKALATVAGASRPTTNLLLRILGSDQNDRVRAACARR